MDLWTGLALPRPSPTQIVNWFLLSIVASTAYSVLCSPTIHVNHPRGTHQLSTSYEHCLGEIKSILIIGYLLKLWIPLNMRPEYGVLRTHVGFVPIYTCKHLRLLTIFFFRSTLYHFLHSE